MSWKVKLLPFRAADMESLVAIVLLHDLFNFISFWDSLMIASFATMIRSASSPARNICLHYGYILEHHQMLIDINTL